MLYAPATLALVVAAAAANCSLVRIHRGAWASSSDPKSMTTMGQVISKEAGVPHETNLSKTQVRVRFMRYFYRRPCVLDIG